MTWLIIKFIVWLFIFSYFLAEIILAIQTHKYQKKWDECKAKLTKIDPKITRAELCEQYVMFCLRNDCKVEF